MGKTNWKRVFLGGVLSGIVFIVLGIIAQMIGLMDIWIPVLESLGLSTEVNFVIIILALMMWLVLGVLTVWLYSAIRPRYGAGVKTAVIVGVIVWVLRELYPAIQSGAYGLYPAKACVIDGLTNLVSCVVATIIGAWIYKEHP